MSKTDYARSLDSSNAVKVIILRRGLDSYPRLRLLIYMRSGE